MRRISQPVVYLFCIIIAISCCFIFVKEESFGLNSWYDKKYYLDSIHFRSLYPSLTIRKEKKDSSIRKQEAIGVCVNFNFNPDRNGNTLASILPYYTMIHKYLVIFTPSPLNELSNANLQLFSQYKVISISVNEQQNSKNDSSPFSKDILKNANTVYHIECANSNGGQYQHKCLLLCAQFYSIIESKDSTLRGILYLADDLYFNFAYVFSHPERFPLDEVWSAPWLQLVDIKTGDKGRLGATWYWWKAKPHFWNSFTKFFLLKSNNTERYREVFEILYGSNKRLAIGIADLLYLPFGDNQLNNFISITKDVLQYFPSDIFCEVIFSLIIDLTMSISGHWPFENDHAIYNSSINRLNNLTFYKDIQQKYFFKDVYDPYSSNNQYRQRPSILNPDGFIWDHHRHQQILFENAILNGTTSNRYSLKPWRFTNEFVHPVKLSNQNHWAFHLWHRGIQLQIERIHFYQKQRIRAP